MSASKINLLSDMTVLVADDDEIILDSLTGIMGVYFGEVLCALDGDQALEIFETKSVHVAILDITMPGRTGLEVAAKIREQDLDLPIIILTCHQDIAYAQAATSMRLMDYLLKPVELASFEACLEKCVAEMQARGRVEVRLKSGAMFNPITGVACYKGKKVQLTRNEKVFLNILVASRGVMIGSQEMCHALVPDDYFSMTALRNLVYRLRLKIGKEAVLSSKENGYMVR